MCKESPRDEQVAQTTSFAADALRDRPRVLEVGRWSASIARRLASLGFEVTTFAASSADPISGVRVVAGTLPELVAEPFDAIILTGTLHRASSLEDTLAHVDRLLKPTGRVLIDDLDVEAADVRTSVWYFDMVAKYAAASARPVASQVLETWRMHRHGGAVHGGRAMRDALEARFAVRQLNRVEYLYRDVAELLPDDEAGARTAAELRSLERHLIAQQKIAAVGIQLVAERAALPALCGARLTDEVVCVRARDHGGLHQWRRADGHTFDWG